MTFLELAKKRYSVRSYLDKPVEEEKLKYILECGRIAPSAANYQPWQIFVVRDAGLRKKLASTYSRDWFTQAPLILVFCGDHSIGWKRSDGKDHTDIDVSIIIDHITLAAAEQDLGTCWICNFDVLACSGILDLPPNLEPIAYLSLGYPAKEPEDLTRHLNRKPLHEIVTDL
ncbi:MAG: nitroreductase family protein [Bacteroidales bacterium]|nr:nitroreductase family protein [Bacteroidales bacterium]